jgi:hypothetical protein
MALLLLALIAAPLLLTTLNVLRPHRSKLATEATEQATHLPTK